jgi:hypothetical protein
MMNNDLYTKFLVALSPTSRQQAVKLEQMIGPYFDDRISSDADRFFNELFECPAQSRPLTNTCSVLLDNLCVENTLLYPINGHYHLISIAAYNRLQFFGESTKRQCPVTRREIELAVPLWELRKAPHWSSLVENKTNDSDAAAECIKLVTINSNDSVIKEFVTKAESSYSEYYPNSAFYYLCKDKQAVLGILLEKYGSLFSVKALALTLTSARLLNETDESGNSAFAWLTSSGPRLDLLRLYFDCFKKILTTEDLNHVFTLEGPLNGITLLFWLTGCPEGRALLSTHFDILARLITTEGLTQVSTAEGPYKGTTPLFWLTRSTEGRALLIQRFASFRELLTREALTQVCAAEGPYKGASPLSHMRSYEVGLAILTEFFDFADFPLCTLLSSHDSASENPMKKAIIAKVQEYISQQYPRDPRKLDPMVEALLEYERDDNNSTTDLVEALNVPSNLSICKRFKFFHSSITSSQVVHFINNAEAGRPRVN